MSTRPRSKPNAFLSTLSLRRATLHIGEHTPARNISIHALLAESDVSGLSMLSHLLYFYPRSPCGERRSPQRGTLQGKEISIHALLAESDLQVRFLLLAPQYFYPRSPCGERRAILAVFKQGSEFLSTLSLRRATIWSHPTHGD